MGELSFYEKQIRPWGDFERFTLNEKTTVKIIVVKPNESLSLQKHSHRREFWKIILGNGLVIIDGDKKQAEAGDSFLIQVESTHRVEAGNEGMSFLEIAFGEFDENDIQRLEDKYGRV